jgi:hypothetical protein
MAAGLLLDDAGRSEKKWKRMELPASWNQPAFLRILKKPLDGH